MNQLNGLALAYIGDAYFELIVREYEIKQGYTQVKELHQRVIEYTKGEAQAEFILYCIENELLSEEELLYYKKGRNCHTNQNRKNVSLATYQRATGFEALIGALYYDQKYDRIHDLFEEMLRWKNGRKNQSETRK